MNVVVTGGFGFQGSALCKRLVKEGHAVTAIDYEPARGTAPEGCKAQFRDLRYEVPDLREFEAVFHLAARVGGTGMTHGPEEAGMMLDNLAIDRNVVSGCLEAKTPRVIYASSASVYPKSSLIAGVPLKESDPLDIMALESGYAVAKLCGETVLYRLKASGRLKRICVLRLFNVYGNPTGTHVIPELMRQGKEDDRVKVRGDGTERRRFLHVDDAVEAYLCALRSDFDGPFNIAGPDVSTIASIADEIGKLSAKPVRYTEQVGLKMDCVPDISLAKVAIGWEPRVSIEDGIRRTWELVRPTPI